MQKFKFNAQHGPDDSANDFFNNPQKYSFVHNFKIHYKRGILQVLANKLDVSITSKSPQLPSAQQVADEFNQRMKATVVVSNTRRRYSEASFHITNVEYKESFAFFDPHPAGQQVTGQPIFCRMCGAQLPSDSKFCNNCGSPVI